MPHLVKLHNTFSDSIVQIIGINIQDSPKRVEREVDKMDLPYSNLIGRGTSIAKTYKVTILPYLYIIDKEGVVEYGEIFAQFDFMKDMVSDLTKASK